MARAPRFELGNGGSKVRCLTAWLRPIIISLQNRRHVAIISRCKGIGKVLILQTLPSEFWGSIIALRWVVRPVFNDKSNFMAINLTIVCGVRELQEYFFSDGEVLPF